MRISVFFIVFHTLYFLMNFYVFRRLLGCFGVSRAAIIWPLVLICTFSLFVATIAYYRIGSTVYPLYFAATLWFGVLWLLFCCLVVSEPVRLLFRNVKPPHIGTAILVIVGLTTLYGLVNASRLKVARYTIDAPVELRIAQISDLHLGSVRPWYARKVAEKVNSLEPDAVVLTGDILDSLHPISTDGLAYLSKIKAPVFCVMGNHERYAGLEGAAEAFRSAGFTVLRGETAEFRGVRFIGFDDAPRPSSTGRLLSGIDIDPTAYNILLSHHPVGFPDAAAAGIRLMLSGHTHHGQIWPFSFVVRRRFSHPFGLYRHGDATLYTSPGTGTWGPRMRVGTSSEIAVFDLRPAQSGE